MANKVSDGLIFMTNIFNNPGNVTIMGPNIKNLERKLDT